MTGDRYAFRQRFNRWKQGERYWSIIGQPLPHYADGKDSDLEYYGYMERLANKKAGDWAQIPLRIDPDVTLTEMLNDNTYNYRKFYDNDRYLAEGMLYDNPYAHFSDTGKTVYHPTFSTDSSYSNRKSDYNPEGIEGGSWINNEYRVSRDQMNSKYFNPRRTLNYLKYSDPNVQMVLPLYRGGKNSKSSFVQQLETQPTVLQPAVQEWGDMWKERVEPAAKSKVLLKWNATGRKPKPETSQEYTNRRIKETTERTWRSDAADIAHGIGEGVLALNPYTAIPYYGAKVGQDILSGNVGWQTAVNASIPLFHLSPQAVGLKEATNVALEDVANSGSKTARNWRIAREINLTTKSKPKYTRVPSKNLFRTLVYKGGEIADPYSNFITTDPLYAANYGKVTPYIFESKSIAKAKEPMMGYRDPVSLDMFIYNNTKRNPNATAIIGHDAVTGEFTPSKGIEILNMNPKNLYPVRTLDFPTSLKFFERKPSKISQAEREGIPKGERNLLFKEKQLTPAQWTAAQDAAIARGDMAEAQRLRDLHFQTSAPNTKADVPLWTSSEEAFNSFDLSHFGETDNGFFGYGHYLTPIEKYAATYHPINRKFYVNIENPYIGSNDQYFNRIQYVKDRLAMRKENVMRNLRDGKLTKFSKKLGINENTSLKDAEHLVDKYIADETVKWKDKYVKYADEFEGKDGVLSWRELQGIPNKQEGIYREVVVPRGEQIKSVDAVTYDNNGVRIPLGERDNFNINDIRYAIAPILAGDIGYGAYRNQKSGKTRPIKK